MRSGNNGDDVGGGVDLKCTRLMGEGGDNNEAGDVIVVGVVVVVGNVGDGDEGEM